MFSPFCASEDLWKTEMASSNCMGLMAVVAVSGSVALVALQLHKHLLSEFMKKVELELAVLEETQFGELGYGFKWVLSSEHLGSERNRAKKKVRFAADVIEPSSNNKEYRKRRMRMPVKPDRAMDDVSISLEMVN